MIKIQGHRGFSDSYPENTMLSFQKTYETGAFGIEVDIRKTSDGVYVLIHDVTVDRTTNGTGSVDQLTYDYISTLDAGSWFGAEFAGREDCKVPTLDQLLDAYKGLDITLVLHINLYTSADAQAVVDMVVAKSMLNQVHIFGEHVTINAAKAYNPNVFTLNSSGKRIGDYQTDLDNAIQNNHDCVSINAGNSLEDMKIMIANIKSYGKMVHVSYLSWGYDTNLAKLIEADVDFALGNNPQLMQNYVNSVTPEEPVPEPPLIIPLEPASNIMQNYSFIKTNDGYISLNQFAKTTYGLIGCQVYNAD